MSESDFSLVRLKKRRRHSSNKRSESDSTTIKVLNKNNGYKKLGKKNDKVKNNNIERTVRR